MSATTELVRHVVQDVLGSEPDVDSELARAIGTKIAGDPEIDRVDIAEDTLEPVAHRVADATYRIDLDGFGVADPDRARREIVERVTQQFAAQTTDTESGKESDSAVSEDGEGDQPISTDETSDDEIIVAGPDPDQEEIESPGPSEGKNTTDQLHVGAAAVNTGTNSNQNQSTSPEKESTQTGNSSDDIIVAESDDIDTMDTAYDEGNGPDESDDDTDGEPTIMW